MAEKQQSLHMFTALQHRPDAWAFIEGGEDFPRLRGTVKFWQTTQGVLVAAEVTGLPSTGRACPRDFFGFHIHCGGQCAGTADEPFAETREHYNPERCPHPAHAGDLPPLLSNNGYAAQAVLTDRFTVREIIGKTVVIHSGADDFTSQPGRAAGEKIACGEIRRQCR